MKKHLIIAVGLLLALCFLPQLAWAADVPLAAGSISWQEGNTYVANEDLTIEERVTVTGNATLKLARGTLTVKKGIHINPGVTLTIEGDGTLLVTEPDNDDAGIEVYGANSTLVIKSGNIGTAEQPIQGGVYGAGIGGGDHSQHGGIIKIEGGNVYAASGSYGAGIGAGNTDSVDSITIVDCTNVRATSQRGAGIGGGDETTATVGDITIEKVSAIEANSSEFGAGIGGGNEGKSGDVKITNCTSLKASVKYGAGVGGGNDENATVGSITIDGVGTIDASSSEYGAGIGGGNEGKSGNVKITNGASLTASAAYGAGIGGGSDGNATVGSITIDGVDTIDASSSKYGAGIGGGDEGRSYGDVTITNGTSLTASAKNGAGVGGGSDGKATVGSITIDQVDTIDASSSGSGAGIGGGDEGRSGDVIITKVTNLKASAKNGAGIGGGYDKTAKSNSITINEVDTIDVSSSGSGAGIGGGDEGQCGNVTITHCNSLKASAKYGAGIGGGEEQTAFVGDITIDEVKEIDARSNSYGAGIGGGFRGSSGKVSIQNGTILKASAGNGAGIGGGSGLFGINAETKDITIKNVDKIDASSSNFGAGIGGGEVGQCGNVTITQCNSLTASAESGAGIGSGYYAASGDIFINDSKAVPSSSMPGNIIIETERLTASGVEGAGIGAGYDEDASAGAIRICGGQVTASSIGDGSDAKARSFATTSDGKAIIFADRISDMSGEPSDWRGIIFIGDSGKVYGDQMLATDFSLADSKTLLLPQDNTLTVIDNKTISVGDGQTFTIDGTLDLSAGSLEKTDQGTVIGKGTITPEEKRLPASIDPFSVQNVVYNGNAATPSGIITEEVYKGDPTEETLSNIHFNYSWYDSKADGSQAESVRDEAPIDAGTYYIKAVASGSGLYRDAVVNVPFMILPSDLVPIETEGRVTCNDKAEQTLPLSPAVKAFTSAGDQPLYASPVITAGAEKIAGTPSVTEDGILHYRLADGAVAGDTVLMTVQVSGLKNYANARIVVTIHITDKPSVSDNDHGSSGKSSGSHKNKNDNKDTKTDQKAERIVLHTDGGSNLPSISGKHGEIIDLSAYTPEREGYTFTGWYADKECTRPITRARIDGDTTIYAGWEKITKSPFRDVAADDWFAGDVDFVNEHGLMVGTAEALFSPGQTTNRAMIVAVLHRLAGNPAAEGHGGFADVVEDAWYAEPIAWTAVNGVAAGYDSDHFGPTNPVTREQLVAFFYKYAQLQGWDVTAAGDLSLFTDAGHAGTWAETPLRWAIGSGILGGKGDGILDPSGLATRAEFAAMLHRYVDYFKYIQ